MNTGIDTDEFGCFTGDCPHDNASECVAAIKVLLESGECRSFAIEWTSEAPPHVGNTRSISYLVKHPTGLIVVRDLYTTDPAQGESVTEVLEPGGDWGCSWASLKAQRSTLTVKALLGLEVDPPPLPKGPPNILVSGDGSERPMSDADVDVIKGTPS